MSNYARKEEPHFTRIPPDFGHPAQFGLAGQAAEKVFLENYTNRYNFVLDNGSKDLSKKPKSHEQGRKNKTVHRRKDGSHF